ncbi:MAG: hypothetical protein M0Z96_05070 [Actinomycetota bacterium]|nr:hypothetical protein [Actinomycetota bacterium]
MEKFQFLSPEWIGKARQIREAHRDSETSFSVTVRMNQLVTDLPFGSNELRTFVDTSKGLLDIELGELDNPDVSVVIDYQTARAIFVDLDSQAAIQAFMAGKIKVTGDLTKLMALQGTIVPSESGMNIAKEIKEMTA